MQFYFRVIDLKSVVAGSLLQCMLQNRPFRLWREILSIKNIRTDFSSALYMICSSVNHLFPNVICLLKSLDFDKQSLNICVLLPDLRLASSNHVFKHLDLHLFVHFQFLNNIILIFLLFTLHLRNLILKYFDLLDSCLNCIVAIFEHIILFFYQSLLVFYLAIQYLYLLLLRN